MIVSFDSIEMERGSFWIRIFLFFLFCTKSLAFKFSCLLRISAVSTYFGICFLTFGSHRIFGIGIFVLGFRFLIRNKTLRWLPRVLRPRASWALVWREILNPREVRAKNKNKDGFPFP